MKHTRASVVKRVEDEYAALDRIVRRLTPADFRKPAMRAEAPIRFNIKDTNAGIYRRSRRTPARTIVAEHRAANRAMLRALRGAPNEYFVKQRGASWPFDAVGHVLEHRRKHLEPIVSAKRPTARAAR